MTKIIAFICICLCFLSCSDDDDADSCSISTTTISMTIDGEAYLFSLGGRGIDLTVDGRYDLRLWLNHYNQETDIGYQIIVKLFLHETGSNVIDSFYFIKSDYLNAIEGDFVNSNFSDTVYTNNKNCFSAVFSGEFTSDENETITITEGKLDVVYEDPFD